MKSPARRRTFLILAVAVWLLMPVAEAAADILYFMLPHDPNADSPGVAIMQITGLATTLAIVSPLFALFVWFVYRRYAGARPLFSFGRARPLLSSVLWVVFGSLALLFLSGLLFVRRIPDLPWAAHGVLAAYFLLSCNAALVAAYASHAKA
jgi:hypothetical protein